jgi:hypothetical protein
VGHGQGLWPAHPVFRFREEVTFAATGKAFLTYQQRTFALDDGRALHVETGYLRGVGGDGVEFLIVQPTGYTEIHTGTMTPHGLTLQLADLSPSPAALRVTDLYRRIALEGRALTYLLRLAMHQEPLSDHLAGRAAPADPVPVNRHERPGTHPTVGAAPARTGGPDWSPAAAVTFARSMGAGMATGWALAWHRALTGWSRSSRYPGWSLKRCEPQRRCSPAARSVGAGLRSAAEESGEESAAGSGGLSRVSGAAVGAGNPTHHRLDMLPASGPRHLPALPTFHCTTHVHSLIDRNNLCHYMPRGVLIDSVGRTCPA